MLLAMQFGVGFKTGVLSSRIGSSIIALVFTDLVVFIGISNSGIKKLDHLYLNEFPICVSTQLF